MERNGVGLQRGVSSIDTALEKEKRDKKPRPQRTFRTDELLLSTNQKPDLGIVSEAQENLIYKVPVPCYELGEFIDTYCVFAIEMYCQCSVFCSNQSSDSVYIYDVSAINSLNL